MDIEQLRTYCLNKPDTRETLPFGPDTLVFKINSKIFLLVGLDSYPLQFNVKADPDKALEQREEYPHCIIPGFHMNKKHWNTIIIEGSLSRRQLQELIDDSYALVKGKKQTK